MIETISNEQLAKGIGNPGVVIVDVRQPEEYAARHIPGAVLAPHTDIEVYLADLPRYVGQAFRLAVCGPLRRYVGQAFRLAVCGPLRRT